ncbi:glucodextranase DOMON-like domain-containing protein [Orenia marismortui]|uniref:glucodextranase DOMON-like domain-containing protein n=1 Tax=Orenia marismortui TaxID=46469 RepID=UPI00035E2FC1|nr:glucodextranase DOMON-like domain-containing protein [Orenia marismortui]
MLRLMNFILVFLIIFFCICYGSIVEAESNIIFQMNDPVGDEYGPGTYTYPKNEQFSPYEGLFDLTYFKVDSSNENYNLYFKFIELVNPWHAKYGFSHQLVQVYISNSDEGKLETFKKGANIRFEERNPWNKLIKITGWSLEVFDYQDKATKDAIIKEDRIEILDDKKTIKVSIPKELLGDLSKAQYYVLVGSLDGFAYDNYREVIKESEGWKFGGGSNTDLNPNVLDILVPEGMDQKEILGSFDLQQGRLAVVRAVGPELGLHWKLIIIFGFLTVFLATIIGAGIKYLSKLFTNV